MVNFEQNKLINARVENMAEQFREDPTKKVAKAEGGEQRAAETVKPREIPPAETKLRQDRQDSKRALESIGDLLRDEKGNDTVWNIKISQQWGPEVTRALQEPKGSVTVEREDLVEPMSMLAWHALRRENPANQKMVAQETVPEIQKLNAEDRQRQELARKAMNALMERYPDGIGASALSSEARQVEAIGTLGQKLTTIGDIGFAGLGHQLDSLSRNDGIHTYRRLFALDTVIEEVARMMAEGVHEDVESGMAEDESRHKANAAEVLPILKSLLVLRKAMSKQVFGHEKSPNDVWALDEARWEAEEAAKGTNATTDSPISQSAGERPKIKSSIGADEMATMRARAEALRTGGQKTETVTPPVKTEQAPKPANQERPSMTPKQLENSFNTLQFESIDQVRAMMTPDVRQALLDRMLAKIDDRIATAKRLYPNREALLGAQTLGNIDMWSAPAKVNLLPLAAAEGRLPSNDEMQTMKIADYLKRTFGYDLSKDPQRSAELRLRTNMLE